MIGNQRNFKFQVIQKNANENFGGFVKTSGESLKFRRELRKNETFKIQENFRKLSGVKINNSR